MHEIIVGFDSSQRRSWIVAIVKCSFVHRMVTPITVVTVRNAQFPRLKRHTFSTQLKTHTFFRLKKIKKSIWNGRWEWIQSFEKVTRELEKYKNRTESKNSENKNEEFHIISSGNVTMFAKSQKCNFKLFFRYSVSRDAHKKK